MGVGKTTVGRHLADMLNYEFYDSDREIEKKSGATIPWIFDVEGESGFRKRESAMIDELTQMPSIVLATGGGAVIFEENRQHLMSRGIVVYLKADIDELVKRTQHDKSRPLLQTENPREKLVELIREREPWYLEVADLVFDTRHKNSHTAARNLLAKLESLEK